MSSLQPPFNWLCPYCNHDVTVTHEDFHEGSAACTRQSAEGARGVRISFITCPNPTCRHLTITAEMTKIIDTRLRALGGTLKKWTLLPETSGRVFPDYVPNPIREDYEEAVAIRDLSPKASATLSRRALQGMIRDFWKVRDENLKRAIDAIKDDVDPMTWEAIEAVRKVGNIGAHMEKDINLVVEVETEETDRLIWLIETLIGEWYINRHERQQRLKELAELAEQKEQARKGEAPA